jgi:hypothetical protein
MHLLKKLAVLFPGLPLEPPLFYRWPIALRFELNAEAPNTTYHEAVLARAKTIYESAFAPTDLCYLATTENRFVRFGRHRRGKPDTFALSRKLNLGLPRPSGIAALHKTKEEAGLHYPREIKIRWAEISPRTINYPFLLKAISFSDYPVAGGGLADTVFFVNLTRNLILHMYDDRGLDLIATTRAALQPIYDTHKAWLLPYDLAKMQAAFEG